MARTRADGAAPRPGRARFLCIALAIVVLAACGGSGSEPPPGAQPRAGDLDPGADDSTVRPVLLADLQDTVTSLTAHPGDGALYVARRSGAVYRMRLTESEGHTVPVLDPEPVLDLSATVTTDGERGLFDLIFSPDGATLFTSHTDPDGAITVTRFPFGNGIDSTEATVVARVQHPYSGHNGGDLEWLDDQTLLWSLGDMDLTATAPPAAQDPSRPLGTIVRLDPFPATAATEEDLIGPARVAGGLRNPWRMHVDAAAGTLVIGDVGGDEVEEIDVLDLETDEVPNFGWPYFEGRTRTDLPYDGDETFVEPAFERAHGEEVCSIVAGVTVPESLSRSLAGRFLVGDNCSGEVLAVDLATGTSSTVADVGDGIVAFAKGAHDDVYAMGIGGAVWRLDPAGWEVAAPDAVPVDPPAEDEDGAAPAITIEEFQATCATRTAFDLLGQIPDAGPAAYRRLSEEAATLFTAAAADLPDEIDPQPFAAILDAVAAVGRATGWDTTSPAFVALFADVTAARPPYSAFPDAMAEAVELGGAC